MFILPYIPSKPGIRTCVIFSESPAVLIDGGVSAWEHKSERRVEQPFPLSLLGRCDKIGISMQNITGARSEMLL